ncbi:MAG: 3-deoxy-8-phosphooctulonate synthase [Candidatus Dadabacteria bacterium]|nr:MAG: 3-deoxy-8-phosphooctulonate synthase [Candidatus Dadabacteria bacterium]
MTTPFQVGTGPRAVTAGDGNLFLIAGPCVIESRESALRHAEQIARICDRYGLPVIFKSSYDKANRTSLHSFRGPGLEEGLRILAEVKDRFALPVLTDVHECCQVDAAAEVADVLQIPALLSRQTDLLQRAGATGKVVNLKKGQFMAPWDMRHAVEKVRSAGASGVMATERGTSFGYGNLVVDFRSLPVLAELEVAVVFDATHSVQLPSAGGAVSSGERRFIAPLARAAVAVGIDGLFLEVHEDPDRALSDGPNSLPLEQLPALAEQLLALHAAAGRREALA